mmetsp:Transcript_9399/g.20147  ORF Transcript_9399/g.20147 Transcript_9399/m.20147 type:complete len:88 (+) Transcript_9399:639-902(+)
MRRHCARSSSSLPAMQFSMYQCLVVGGSGSMLSLSHILPVRAVVVVVVLVGDVLVVLLVGVLTAADVLLVVVVLIVLIVGDVIGAPK